jgi:hypothetical protein
MKRAAGLTIASIFAAFLASASSYYALEVRGGSRVYAADEPVRKGRMMLFHRYPDGVYMSLAASEVEKVVAVQEPPQPAGLAPGQEISIGSSLPGPRFVAPPATDASQLVYPVSTDQGYGYSGSYWGGGGYVPPRPPVPPSPSRIGPNGFPILAPAGAAGSTPPPIGPNGFPVLAPQSPAPVRRPG